VSVIERSYANLDYSGRDFIATARDYLNTHNSRSLGNDWRHDIVEYKLVYAGTEHSFSSFADASKHIAQHGDVYRHSLHFQSTTGRFIFIDARQRERIELRASNNDRTEQFVARIEELLKLERIGEGAVLPAYEQMQIEKLLQDCGWQRDWIVWGVTRSQFIGSQIPVVRCALDERYYLTFDRDTNGREAAQFIPGKSDPEQWLDFSGPQRDEVLEAWARRVVELIEYGGGLVDGPRVWFLEAGKPRTAHTELSTIFNELSGELRICDPYYGTGSLARLGLLTHCGPIRFLTRIADRQESATLPRLLTEFMKEHPQVSFKRHVNDSIHDRFILSDKEIVLLGHGLKDAGNKESLITRLPRDIIGDMTDALTQSFDQKWAAATVLP